MPEIVLFIVAIICGLLVLGWSAQRFVAGASTLARSFGVSPLIIGLTIVAFGTSAPEMLISAIAAWQGNSGIAIGNAIGSNIANIALVLGVTAFLIPLTVQSDLLKREYPLMLAVLLAAQVLIWNGVLSRVDALLLLTGMVILIFWTIRLAHTASPEDPLGTEFIAEIPSAGPLKQTGWTMFYGLVLLLLSSKLMVWGAVGLAGVLGVSDLVIGLTIVAIGTSLPELATTIVAASRGDHAIAVGNIVGSNMFNIMAVLGIAGIIHPGKIDAEILTRDFPLMIGLSIALYLMARGGKNSTFGRIQRWEGFVLLAVFITYQVWIIAEA